MSEWIPPAAMTVAADVERFMGVKPTIHRASNKIWIITIDNGRVRNEISVLHRAGSKSRARNPQFRESRVWVDGILMPPCATNEDFYFLFHHTDEYLEGVRPEPKDLPEMPPLIENWESTASGDLETMLRQLAILAERRGMEFVVGGSELHWACMLNAVRDGREIVIRIDLELANGTWVPHRPVAYRDGRPVDIEQLPKDLMQLLAQMRGAFSAKPSATGPVTKAALVAKASTGTVLNTTGRRRI